MCSPIVCSRVTAVQHGALDPVLGPPHSEGAFLTVKPSASAGDLQEAGKTKPVLPTSRHRPFSVQFCYLALAATESHMFF